MADLITYFNEKGLITPNHLNRLINPNKDSYPGDMPSLVYTFIRLSEELIVDALNELDPDNPYERVIVSPTTDIADLNRRLLKQYNALILRKNEETNQYVVACKETDKFTIDKMAQVLSVKLVRVNTINAVLAEKCVDAQIVLQNVKVERKTTARNETSAIIDLMILDAIQSDVNDIHIETVWDNTVKDYRGRVKFRISPDLLRWPKMVFTVAQVNEIKNVLCDRAGVASSDANEDEGFKFLHNLNFPDYEFRVSFQKYSLQYNPETSSLTATQKVDKFQSSYVGLMITIRIQEISKNILPTKDLNLGIRATRELKESYDAETGIIGITGAFGAGKNTTYAAVVNESIQEGKGRDQVVVEIGNPIEYKLPIVQITYKNVEHVRQIVSSMKTHDIDKMIITEFRDPATGHLIKDNVLSNIQVMMTFHISRAWDFLEKYREYFGMNDFYAMLGMTRQIFHQVMFKELCPNCKVELPYDKMTQKEKKTYNALKLHGHKVYTARSYLDTDYKCALSCYGGYTASRLPMAESLCFNKQNAESVDLMTTLLEQDSLSLMSRVIKNYMVANGLSFEYLARKRLIDGTIDFRLVVQKEITEHVTDEGITKYEEGEVNPND